MAFPSHRSQSDDVFSQSTDRLDRPRRPLHATADRDGARHHRGLRRHVRQPDPDRRLTSARPGDPARRSASPPRQPSHAVTGRRSLLGLGREVRVRRGRSLGIVLVQPGVGTTPHRHEVFFYDVDRELVAAVVRYVSEGLAQGEPAVVIATAPHLAAIDEALRAQGTDVASARATGAYLTLDAADTLATFMVDGSPDPDILMSLSGVLLDRPRDAGSDVRAFGEMVALLWGPGQRPGSYRTRVAVERPRRPSPVLPAVRLPHDRTRRGGAEGPERRVPASHRRTPTLGLLRTTAFRPNRSLRPAPASSSPRPRLSEQRAGSSTRP